MGEIAQRLDQLRADGLYRRLRLVAGPQGPRVMLDGRRVLLLCSNNYLGFADHPRVRTAAAEAAMRYGVGAGAPRPVPGDLTPPPRPAGPAAAVAPAGRPRPARSRAPSH